MRKDISLLILGWEFPPNNVGGLGTHTYNLVKSLVKKGIKVNLALPKGEKEIIEGVNYIELPKLSVKYGSKLNFSNNSNNIIEQVENYKKAMKIVKDYNFDLIHSLDWLTSDAGVYLKQLTNKKLLVAMHSLEYDRTGGHPWKYIEDKERYVTEKADIVVAVSERTKEEIVKFYNINPNKIRVIYNGINVNQFKTDKKKKFVLYVGRLTPQKGVDHLIRAFKIATKFTNDTYLIIAGDGPDRDYLLNLTISLNLQDKVIFLGRVSDEELVDLYAKASVFVMPSVSEPFGITALEAAASKTPTIISKQSGVKEVLDSAITVDFWDEYALADYIHGLLSYPYVKEELGEALYRKVTTLSWDAVADRYIEVYNELLQ
ncbi:MAG: glycosyltransferase family 4 protein [Candidatus Parvarchaeota archaeon]|nr:glycosyltransferase family 4 protein [Candidatus Rehaiarchaeum fermentans]MCW1293653.1 glycosyltransferase family 4 protein [Candidatus Rehaiarchaeum fermentans]